MRKLTSLTTLILAGIFVVGCSSNKEFEESSAQDLYSKGQTYLQDNDYSNAIRYLEAVETKANKDAATSAQTLLSLAYANYKIGEYYKSIDLAERFSRAYPDYPSMDYVYYLVALSYARLGDNFIQDLFNVDRSSRALTSSKSAYGNFQMLIQHYPNSQYAADAQNWMRFLENRIMQHELGIVKFYDEREAYVAVVNRVQDMLKTNSNSKAAYEALTYMQKAYQNMGIPDSAAKVAALIEEGKNKTFPEVPKPEYSEQF